MSPFAPILNQNSRPSFQLKIHFTYYKPQFRRILNIIAKNGNQRISNEIRGVNFGGMTKLQGLSNADLSLLFEYSNEKFHKQLIFSLEYMQWILVPILKRFYQDSLQYNRTKIHCMSPREKISFL